MNNLIWCLPLVLVLGMNIWLLWEIRSFRKWLESKDDKDDWTPL